MHRIVDISVGLGPELMVWPGDPPIEVLPSSRISRGDAANVSELRLGSHSGTHVDPPCHFVEGAPSIDQVPLETLTGDATVAAFGGPPRAIGAADLEGLRLPGGVTRLLLKTSNSELWRSPEPRFPERYSSLSVDGARWAVDRGLRLVGIDFLSIESGGPPNFPVHHTLLRAGVAIVEGLDLSAVEPGEYTLACFPLKIVRGDGGPARAVLIQR